MVIRSPEDIKPGQIIEWRNHLAGCSQVYTVLGVRPGLVMVRDSTGVLRKLASSSLCTSDLGQLARYSARILSP